MFSEADQEFVTRHMAKRSKLDIIECLVIAKAINSEKEITPELIMELKAETHDNMNEHFMSIR